MVQIIGKYEHGGYDSNFESFLKALKLPEASISGLANYKPTLTISENSGQWTFHNSSGGKDRSATFKLGEAYDEVMPHGAISKNVTRREGDKLIVDTEIGSIKETKVYEFTENGITMHVSSPNAGDVTTSVVYKRV